MIFLFALLIIILSFINNTVTQQDQDYQEKIEIILPYPDYFLDPIEFSKVGVKQFMLRVFNRPTYARDFLPYNFGHLDCFLIWGNRSKCPRDYIKSILDLWTQKFKSIPYADARELDKFLQNITRLSQRYFNKMDDLENRKSMIEKSIKKFINLGGSAFDHVALSEQINVDLLESESGYVSVEKLQHSISEFCEVLLSRVVWSPLDQEEVWRNFKSIADRLKKLYEINMLTGPEALDKLYWSLVYRFSYVLDTIGSDLTKQCYTQMKKDIEDCKLHILTLEESEDYITTKLEYLRNVAFEGTAKAIAKERGILSEMVVKPRRN